ncbi:hypothetical protein [Planctomycetes bacterium TBK1r]|uniref:Uncharacterized protein n=1 Tax=Stieleria magnilauensis TaxID=2527963 RepID=A0ABX5Y0B8_9BACT|nr:hypothetical protein TBK1r_59880 [Planctomycetes bacterium TBK1r]QDV87039.1 hypothetical protein TBK1r_60660 [Planctomycetes bacterium TBK1r]
MIYLGVDPGASGAIVAIDGNEIMHARNDWTERDVSDWLSAFEPLKDDYCFAILEQVSAMPKQGVSSTFKFGRSYGFLRGLLIAHRIPFETVTPAKWQQVMRCRSKGDKNVTKARAQELFPTHKWTHRTADAVLLAEYGRRTMAERVMHQRLDDERRNITEGK